MIDPDNDPVLLLSDVARLIRTEADRRARRLHMTRAQWVILSRVQRTPGLSQRELAELLEVEPITVGRLVDRLEAGGLVERRPDPGDRRTWRLHLRDAAEPVLASLDIERVQLTELALGDGQAAEIAGLIKALQRVKANMVASRRDTASALKVAI